MATLAFVRILEHGAVVAAGVGNLLFHRETLRALEVPLIPLGHEVLERRPAILTERLPVGLHGNLLAAFTERAHQLDTRDRPRALSCQKRRAGNDDLRSEEHTSELQ